MNTINKFINVVHCQSPILIVKLLFREETLPDFRIRNVKKLEQLWLWKIKIPWF